MLYNPDQLKTATNETISNLQRMIDRTPSGDDRNTLTDTNILLNFYRAKFDILDDMIDVSYAIGAWRSAALGDPNVCAEMKRDINRWFDMWQRQAPPQTRLAGVSSTPRTDALQYEKQSSPLTGVLSDWYSDMRDLAVELEQENTRLRAAIEAPDRMRKGG